MSDKKATATATATPAPNRIVTKIAGEKLRFDLPNGTVIHLDVAKLSEDLRIQGMLHGFKQKVSDAAAKSGASWKEKADAMQAVVDAFNDGQFNRQRAAGGAHSLLAQVLSTKREQPLDVVKTYLSGLTPSQVRALEVHFADEINALRRATVETVDVDALLDGLTGL